jgi:hypothetical protein
MVVHVYNPSTWEGGRESGTKEGRKGGWGRKEKGREEERNIVTNL